jgi:hypothetical protein
MIMFMMHEISTNFMDSNLWSFLFVLMLGFFMVSRNALVQFVMYVSSKRKILFCISSVLVFFYYLVIYFSCLFFISCKEWQIQK